MLRPVPRHCGAGVRLTHLLSRSTDRAGRRDRRVNGCGNPFFPSPVIANAVRRVAIRSLLRGITDSFALCAQNDISFSHCEHRKVRGNPFPPLRVLRILSRFAFRMTTV